MKGNIGRTLQVITVDDPTGFRRGITIPLPGDRALRIGFGFEAWCRIGPRKYQVVIPEHVWNQMVDIAGVDGAEQMRAELEATLAIDPHRGTPLSN